MLIQYLAPRPHVSPHQLVCSALMFANLELALTQSKMNERIANRSGTMHRGRQIVASSDIVSIEIIRITNRYQNPGGCLPFCLRQSQAAQ